MPPSISPGLLTENRRLAILASALLALLLAALDQTVVTTALPRIAADLHGFSQLSWIVTAYLLTSTATVPIYGKLSDSHGRRAMFVVAIVAFIIGSVLCGASQTMWQLIAARAIQGLGGGGLLALVQTTIGDLFAPRERGRYQVFISGVWMAAALAGPLIGGLFTDSVGWRWIFFINVPLGMVALIGIATQMKFPVVRRQHRIDYAGAATLSSAIVCIVLAAVWGGHTYPWGSIQIIVLVVATVVLAVAFVRTERTAAEPLIPLSLFRDRTVVISNLAMISVGALVYGVTVNLPVFIQGVKGSSATLSGLLLLPFGLSWIVAGNFTGRMIARTGRYRVFPIVGFAVVMGGILLLMTLDIRTSTRFLVLASCVLGVGFGLSFQVLIVVLQNAVDRSMLGVATASSALCRSIGGTVGLAVFGTILASRLDTELPKHLGNSAGAIDPDRILRSPDSLTGLNPGLVEGVRLALSASLHTVFVVMLPLAVIAFIASVLLEEHPLRTTTDLGVEAGGP